jgi:acyl-ACP thioesterase
MVRTADLDVFGHVNNAVAWAVVEEGLAASADRRGVGEIEYPAPLDLEPVQRVVARDGPAQATWLVSVDGAVRVATRWTPAGAAPP